MLIAPDKPLPVQIQAELINLQALQIIPGKRNHQFRIAAAELPEAVQVFYTVDGSAPDKQSSPISKSFTAEGKFQINFQAYRAGRRFGDAISQIIEPHLALGKKVVLRNPPSPKYPGSGRFPLTDGQTGSADYLDGKWLGFEGSDLTATIDLGKKVVASKVRINFLRRQSSWIFLPRQVTIQTSTDGKSFTTVHSQSFQAQQGAENKIETVVAPLRDGKIRFVKIVAKNLGECPPWHYGAGGKAWLFVDEIAVE